MNILLQNLGISPNIRSKILLMSSLLVTGQFKVFLILLENGNAHFALIIAPLPSFFDYPPIC